MSKAGKLTLWIAVPVVIIIVVLAIWQPWAEKEEEVIKIGAILPLTGDYALYGEKMKNSIDLGVELRESESNINNIELIYEDDQGDPKTSVSSFNKLTSDESIQVIIGGIASPLALPIAPLSKEKEVVLFSPAASAPSLSNSSPFFFRNWPPDNYEGEVMAELAYDDLDLRNISILYVNNDWGIGLFEVFSDRFEELGGKILYSESFEEGTTDVRTQLLKIKNSESDAIYCPGYLKELIVITKQIKEMGIDISILSSSGFYDPEIITMGGKSVEGTIFPIPIYDPEKTQKEHVKEFVNIYEDKYGEKPDIWAAQAFDAINIILDAFENGNYSSDKIREYILGLKDYPGVSGKTTFLESGDVVKPLRIMQVKNGEFVEYKQN